MIAVDRFIARSSDRELWLAAREQGVTATQVAAAATPAGFREQVALIEQPSTFEGNPFTDWGTLREPVIALAVKDEFGVMPNDWLIAFDSGLNKWMLATPDGLSLDHTRIAEIKTGGKPFTSIPIAHRRQMQWQMNVCGGTEKSIRECVYAYEQRLTKPDSSFEPAFDIHFEIVQRDEQMIADLIQVAEQLQQVNVYRDEAELDLMEGH